MSLNSNIKKIVVKPDQELTDIIRLVKSAKEDRIVLTFTEKSDMLVSPINLKVLLEEADVNSKVLVTQVIQNPAGIRNSRAAGIVTTDASGAVDEELWTQAEETFTNRVAAYQNQLKSNRTSHQDTGGEEHGHTVDMSDSSDGKKPEDLAESNEITFEDQNPELVHVEELQQEQIDGIKEDLEIKDMSQTVAPTQEMTAEELAAAKSAPEEMTPFQKRVNSAIQKSQEELTNKNHAKVVKESGVSIALDSDIDDQSSPNPASQSMVGKDFNAMGGAAATQTASKIPAISGLKAFDRIIPGASKAGGGRMKFSIAKFNPFTAANMAALKKRGPIVAVPLVLGVLLVTYLFYSNAPYASAKIFIESRPIEAEDLFTGQPGVTEFNIEDRTVQVKQEVVEKGRSDSRETTQTAQRGEKADGIATVKCFLNGSLELAQGTVVTEEGGLQFRTMAAVTMICPWQETVTVEAMDVGSQYNFPSGTIFAVPGYNSSQVILENDLSAFTGGSSEEYRVVGQGDIDNISRDLQASAFEEAGNELREMAVDGWKIIESTITNELDGGVQSDFPVGAETDIVNVSLETKSTALYYKEDELEEAGETLLLDAARRDNLFESDDDIELRLGDDIVTEVNVEKVEGSVVTIKISSSGFVKPSVDKNEIISELSGMGWDEGTKYLDDLSFTSEDPEYEFSPTWFPEFLWRFPTKQGRVKLVVEEIEKEFEDIAEEETAE